MPFAFPGETRGHEIPKPIAQPRLTSRLGSFLSAIGEAMALVFILAVYSPTSGRYAFSRGSQR